MHRFIDVFIGLVIVGILFLGVRELNLFGPKFKDVNECMKYVISSSGNNEKAQVGSYACAFMFRFNDERQKFGKCIVNNLNDIKDDNSGTKVVTSCAESSSSPNLGYVFNAYFNPAARMAKIIQEENEKRKIENLQSYPGQIGLNGLPIGDGIVNMNINGDLKPCMKIGLEVNCD